jgi:hypothetical protein
MPSGAIVKPWDKQVVHSLSEIDAATLREGWPQSRPLRQALPVNPLSARSARLNISSFETVVARGSSRVDAAEIRSLRAAILRTC